jgi:hypothetical protein
MKIVNIVLGVLVLIAAVVSAVFSYFLYEKRVALATGWNQLTEAVYASAKTLDDGSGTDVAKGLSKEKMSFQTYDEAAMRKALSGFNKQSKDIIAQRDAMADALQLIASKTNAGAVSDIKTIAGYAEEIEKVTKQVSKVISDRDRIYNALASKISGIDRNALKRGDASALKPIDDLKRAKDTYRNTLNRIARNVGARALGADAQASAGSAAILRALDAKLKSVDSLRNQLNNAQRKIISLNQTIAAKDKVIAGKNKDIARCNEQIKDLKRALGIAPEEPFAIWGKGSDEARSRLQGKVLKVSDEYGYIVIDLGASSVVYQQAGKKTVDVNLGLANGVELSVVRGDNNEFVATITLDKVGEKESTANIPVDKVGKIQVGDKILYKTAK